MAALSRRRMKVAPFKVGPDFIDPGHHARITGSVSRNLDGWMLSKGYNVDLFRKHAGMADASVVEGVMGLYDGYDGKSESGSTAEMAKWLELPVLLIVDARSMARSAAAVVRGFETFDPALNFAGVIFNRIGSPRHLSYLKDALSDRVVMPCFGGIPREPEIEMPERHLGLVTPEEFTLKASAVDRLVELVEHHLDLDALLSKMAPVSLPLDADEDGETPTYFTDRTHRVRVGVASDAAFCFYYPDNIDILEAYGAEIVRFSPLEDAELPPDLDGLYLGGGYPELFASKLAENAKMRFQIREKSMAGMPIYGECGGFMYLCRDLHDLDGAVHPMVGCFPFETRMNPKLRSLGYREIKLDRDFTIGDRGQTVRGHEFHYSEIEPSTLTEEVETVYRVADRTGEDERREGFRVRRTLGSYIHLHFGSQPDTAYLFVDACASYRDERNDDQ